MALAARIVAAVAAHPAVARNTGRKPHVTGPIHNEAAAVADIQKDFFHACVKALGSNADGSIPWSKQNETACRAAWKRLTYRQREMVKLMCGAGHDERRYELREIAHVFRVTTPYAKRLIAAAQRQFVADLQASVADATA